MRRGVNRALRGILTGVAVLGVWLEASGPVAAGVYTEVERPFLPSLDKFKFWLDQVRDVALNPTGPSHPRSLKAQYQREVKALEAKGPSAWTTLDRINLGGSYLRMGRYEEAGVVLRGAAPRHFLVLHNLAALSFAQGQFQRAVDYQEEALKAWPGVWLWWTNAEMKFYRRAEEYYLALLRIRNEDAAPITSVDPLFEKVRFRPRPAARGERGKAGLALAIREPLRFVGADGKTYEPGGLAWPQSDKLPPDADLLVLQLLLWQPNDLRLEWLLAEILNVRGFPDFAFALMDKLVDTKGGSGIATLRQHRRELLQVQKVVAALRNPKTQLKAHLLGVVTARGLPNPVGLGAAGNEVMAWLPMRLEELAATGQLGPTPATGEANPRGVGPPALPSWRPLAVGFACGLAMTVLVGLQWREWRRRRAATASGEASAVPAAAGPESTADDGTARPTPE